MRPKKLLPREILFWLDAKQDIGVPLSKLIRDVQLDMSQPAIAKLLKQYRQMVHAKCPQESKEIEASLFPVWNQDWPWKIHSIQANVYEQPEGWFYEGYFPYGEWVQR